MHSKIKEMQIYSWVSSVCKEKYETRCADVGRTTSVLVTRKLSNCFLQMLWWDFSPQSIDVNYFLEHVSEGTSLVTFCPSFLDISLAKTARLN